MPSFCHMRWPWIICQPCTSILPGGSAAHTSLRSRHCYGEVVYMSGLARLQSDWEPRVLSILRIVVGLLFMEHGLAKLFGFPPTSMHPAAFQLLWFAGIIEAFGGLLLALGLFTRVMAFIMSGEMAIGYFMSHAPKAFFPLLRSEEHT